MHRQLGNSHYIHEFIMKQQDVIEGQDQAEDAAEGYDPVCARVG